MLDPHDPGVWKNKLFKKGVYTPVSHMSEVLSYLGPTVIHTIKFWDKWHSAVAKCLIQWQCLTLMWRIRVQSQFNLCTVLLFP